MTDKEEIEEAKKIIKEITFEDILDGKEVEENYNSIQTILQYILELELELENQKEINEEHQKLNGELIEENKKLKEIIEGKSIQEMGTSDLYKED